MRFPAFFSFIALSKNKKPKNLDFTRLFGCAFGVPEVIRTPDLPLRRRSLYPAELRKHQQSVLYILWRRLSNDLCRNINPIGFHLMDFLFSFVKTLFAFFLFCLLSFANADKAAGKQCVCRNFKCEKCPKCSA